MRVTRLIAFMVTTLATITLASCNHKDEMEPTYDPGAVVFNVSSQAITDHGIEVVVTHNGGKMDGWVGFLTEDMTTPVYDLIRSQAVPVTRPDFHYGNSQTVILSGLDADKDYRYIAYGMKDDKTIYGIPGVAAFTTSEDLNAIVFSIELIEARGHEADFHVTHTGKEENTWYGFPTTDLETDINDLIAAKAGSVDIFNRGADVKISALELDSDSAYRYIVFGIKEDGAVYGTPASIEFNTAEDLEGVKFTAKAKNLTESTADITVSHDGRDNYQWFGFLTEDVEASVARLVSEQVETVTESDLKTGKDVTITLEDLEIGKPYKYIVAGYKDGEAYGKPGVAEFELTGGEEQSPYEKWLGKWEITYVEYEYNDSGQKTGEKEVTHTWEIKQKVADVSYTISGVSSTKNEFGDVVADFDASTNALSVLPQLTLETTYSGNPDLYYFCAMYGENNLLANGDTPIFTAVMEGDTATLTPGEYQGNTFHSASTLNQYSSKWYLTTGRYDLPNSMKLVEPGEGGGEGEGGEVAYNDWIGDWSLPGGTLSISADEAGSSYSAVYSGWEDVDFKTAFDASTGEMVFYTQFLFDYDIDEYYVIGVQTVDGSRYIRYGDPDKDYELARAKMTGSAVTITGLSYTSEDEGDVTIQAIGFRDYQTEDGNGYEKGWYSLTGYPDITLPASASKSGAGVMRRAASDPRGFSASKSEYWGKTAPVDLPAGWSVRATKATYVPMKKVSAR